MANMLDYIRNFPGQIPAGVAAANHLHKPEARVFSRVIIAGMGGSALPGDILQEALANQVPISIFREYSVPHYLLTKDTLLIVSSYSGNTEETIATLEDALNHQASIVVVSHGGKLAEIANAKNLPLVTLPEAIQPRSATGNFLASMLTIMHKYGVINDPSEELDQIRNLLEQENMRLETDAKSLAPLLKGRVPILYAGKGLGPTARIMKINFNETSKTQSFWNVLPEMNHNEMVGYTNLIMEPHVLFLQSKTDHERVRLRMSIMDKLFQEKGIPTSHITTLESTLLGEMFGLILLGYYASYYLALEYNVDPAPVDMVEDFKKLLVS